jgi:hypothetical protein
LEVKLNPIYKMDSSEFQYSSSPILRPHSCRLCRNICASDASAQSQAEKKKTSKSGSLDLPHATSEKN